MRCMWMLYVPSDCSTNGDHFYLFGAARELWLESYGLKTVSKTVRILVRKLVWDGEIRPNEYQQCRSWLNRRASGNIGKHNMHATRKYMHLYRGGSGRGMMYLSPEWEIYSTTFTIPWMPCDCAHQDVFTEIWCIPSFLRQQFPSDVGLFGVLGRCVLLV